jgi:hypothetical protein
MTAIENGEQGINFAELYKANPDEFDDGKIVGVLPYVDPNGTVKVLRYVVPGHLIPESKPFGGRRWILVCTQWW